MSHALGRWEGEGTHILRQPLQWHSKSRCLDQTEGRHSADDGVLLLLRKCTLSESGCRRRSVVKYQRRTKLGKYQEVRHSVDSMRTVFWFRKGLRLHDNPALVAALEGCTTLYPVFCLDPWFVSSGKVGTNRMRFLLQARPSRS